MPKSTTGGALPRLFPTSTRCCSPQTGVVSVSHYGDGINPFEEDRIVAQGDIFATSMRNKRRLSLSSNSMLFSPRSQNGNPPIPSALSPTSAVSSPENNVVRQARQFVAENSSSPLSSSTLGGTMTSAVMSPRGSVRNARSPRAHAGVGRSTSPLNMDTIRQEFEAFYAARAPLAALLEQRRKAKGAEEGRVLSPPPANRLEAFLREVTKFEEGAPHAVDALELSTTLRNVNHHFTYPNAKV